MGNYCNSTLDFDKILQSGEQGCGFRDPGRVFAAPPWTEVELREKGGQLLGHFIERTFEWRNDLYKTNDPIELSMKLKSKLDKVLLNPENREVNREWKSGSFNVSFPLEQIQTHSILQVLGELKYQTKSPVIISQ